VASSRGPLTTQKPLRQTDTFSAVTDDAGCDGESTLLDPTPPRVQDLPSCSCSAWCRPTQPKAAARERMREPPRWAAALRAVGRATRLRWGIARVGGRWRSRPLPFHPLDRRGCDPLVGLAGANAPSDQITAAVGVSAFERGRGDIPLGFNSTWGGKAPRTQHPPEGIAHLNWPSGSGWRGWLHMRVWRRRAEWGRALYPCLPLARRSGLSIGRTLGANAGAAEAAGRVCQAHGVDGCCVDSARWPVLGEWHAVCGQSRGAGVYAAGTPPPPSACIVYLPYGHARVPDAALRSRPIARAH
jgi:hypothetical protein